MLEATEVGPQGPSLGYPEWTVASKCVQVVWMVLWALSVLTGRMRDHPYLIHI